MIDRHRIRVSASARRSFVSSAAAAVSPPAPPWQSPRGVCPSRAQRNKASKSMAGLSPAGRLQAAQKGPLQRQHAGEPAHVWSPQVGSPQMYCLHEGQVANASHNLHADRLQQPQRWITVAHPLQKRCGHEDTSIVPRLVQLGQTISPHAEHVRQAQDGRLQDFC